MHCHDLSNHINIPKGAKKIVLVGNPNVGKSVFFNALTGLYVDVSNYPGTTLEISHGTFGKDVVIDTPGVYGVSSFNDEETVARDVIMGADIVVNVVDAVHLERDLFLTLQVIDMGIPTIVALNMIDEAEKNGVEIDVDLLSDLLGVPVIPTVAVEKKGVEELIQNLYSAREGKIHHELHKHLHLLLDRVGNQAEALLILESDPHVAERHGLKPGDLREEIYLKRRDRVNDIVKHVMKETSEGTRVSVKLGRMMLHPLTGIPLLLVALYFMYEIIGVLIATNIVAITEGVIMQGYYEPFMKSLVGAYIPLQSIVGKLLVGEFGLLTMTVTYILGLLLPLVVGFYIVLSAMEDSGYLPRIATLVDRLMSFIGLNGRAIIPLILGFGCVTMATITTRLLGSDRERRIATFLLALAIPCSAQLAVIAGLLAPLGPKYMLIFLAILFAVLSISGTLLNKLLPGESTSLLIDLPPLRMPRLENVLKKTFTKSFMFLKEATPLFALGALIIGLLDVSGLLVAAQNLAAPLTIGWLKLPKETANAFIMGFVRRDFGAAGLYSLKLTAEQTIVALTTITLFVPCIASVMVIFKERGAKEGIIMWMSILALAFFIGGIVAHILI